ncbi:tetratricopeptide repeat protein [Falsirhodobacter xinxiangensis]|uniref:tetratricopeptide repeat protein n=1 Tax=Falsirhodobacter xinxiangensis TaxID=2530049 RepID=UPI0010AAC676|nr:tetratricopeptide repeat protein [Rhodobacter xinxiangensis]
MRRPNLARPAFALILALMAQGALAQDSGAYLAARVAGSDRDHRAAAAWFSKALISDRQNPALMEGVIIANIALGDFEKAAHAARALQATGLKSQSMTLALLVESLKADDYAAALGAQQDLHAVGALLERLVTAWAQLGDGRVTEALASFDAIAGTEGLEAFGLYHKALALASAGDMEGADAILAGKDGQGIALLRRGVIAHAEILSQLERTEDALAVLDGAFTADDPTVAPLRAKLAAGEALDYDIARNAREGIAEVFYTLAAALSGEAEDGYTLVYTRAAAALRPDHTEAIVMSADLLAAQGQTPLAIETYAAVPESDPLYVAAVVGRSEAMFAEDRGADAIEVLKVLASDHQDALSVQLALGDALRREERYPEAITAYDKVEALLGTPDRRHWPIFFSRGMSHEQLDQWDEAEADLRQALALDPEQPHVLNYLGYSLVEQGRNLPEALDMIERAVAARPDSGAIQDSLAWAFFKLGRFDEAVAPMEKAAELEPEDAILTDHLGDVYWAVGRKTEARFQWRRALSFEPDEALETRIKRKLEIGLDGVLSEEGQGAFATKLAQNAHGN